MILVFGQTGQVATEIARRAPDATFLGRAAADLSDPEACAAAIGRHRPEAVINAAAYTAVDRSEEEEDLARTVNGAAPGAMARACADLGIPFVHVSTDYVFDGEGETPFAPGDPTAPLGAYGRTKLAGEEAVRGAGGCHAILRTSWVFSAHGGNFVKTMLRLSESRDALSIVDDQIGGPTPAADIAAACLSIVEKLSESRRSFRHLSFLGGAGHELGRFRARNIRPRGPRRVRHRHSHRRLPDARGAAAELPSRLFGHRGRLRHPPSRLAPGARRRPGRTRRHLTFKDPP